ncbi:MAG: cob(I)yrinic acid a,c-diamide adenosyltransferase [Bacillota bacterium]|nr:cob(I)yrinic acid a,c-diamide adenosyltransferase [Bacillota bacterium]
MEKGYVQIYTGDGKGKTTAAIGLGVRAVGNGLKVYMIQFLKSWQTGELNSLKSLEPNFKIFRFEKHRGFFWTLNEKEKSELKEEIQEAYQFGMKAMVDRNCDILILDEIMGAFNNGLITEEQLISLINNKPENIELVMTGRNVPEAVINLADLITEMNPVKHYFDKNVKARKGIEY